MSGIDFAHLGRGLRAGAPPPTGATIGPFELLDEIGRGGMAVVYRARDTRLGRIVALKILREGGDQVERFRREAEIVARLNHPGIVKLFEVGGEASVHYVAMEWVDGEPLSLAMRRLSAREAVEAVERAARALHYAHGQGVIHRDVKPGNILLGRDGRTLVADFGLARAETDQTRLTATGDVLGTPAYMAPEQVLGAAADLGPRTDVYGLGATLHHALAGEPPFENGQPALVFHRIVHSDPRRSPGIPGEIESIILKAMEKDSSRRYASAEAMADDLRRWLDGRPVLARHPSLWAVAVKHVRRRPAVWGLASALLAAVVGGAIFWLIELDRALEAERELGERRRLEVEAARRRSAAEPDFHRASRLHDNLREMRYRQDVSGDERRALAREIETVATRALEADPSYVEALHLRAEARAFLAPQDEAAFRGAEEDFTRALELRPTFTSALYHRGRLYGFRFIDRLLEDYLAKVNAVEAALRHAEWKDRAIADFRRARDLGGEAEDLVVAEVALSMTRLDFEGAVDLARRHRTTGPGWGELKLLAGAALILRDRPDEAEGEIAPVLKAWPRDARARLIHAAMLHHLGRYEEALDDLRIVGEDDPAHVGAWLGIGEISLHLRRYEEARAALERIVAVDPGHAMAWNTLGRLHRQEGRTDEAGEAFERAIEAAPDHAAGWTNRARLRRDLRQWEGADADFSAAIERVRRPDASLHADRGWVRRRLERNDEALADYAEAIRLDDDLATAYFRRAVLLNDLGRHREAVPDLDRYIQLMPADPGGY